MLLHEPFDFHASGRPEFVLQRSEGRDLTYIDGRERSLRMASALLELGLSPGERFVTIMNNSIDAILLIYAAGRLGAVCVPLNCRLAPREWMGMIEDAEARIVIADPAYGEALEEAGGMPAIAISSLAQRPGWHGLDDLVGKASGVVPPLTVSEMDPVLQLYTSGTTGRPKGAMISHRNLLSDISQMSFALGNSCPGQKSLHVLPFFHVAGVGIALRAVSGGETLIISNSTEPAVLLEILVEEEIAYTFLVPTLIQRLISEEGINQLHFPHLRQIIYGASPISEHVLVKAMALFGCSFIQGFGMTELSCAGTFLTEADHVRGLATCPNLLASAGRPIPGTEIRIVDAEGKDCAIGEVGQVLFRGPQVFLGYWKLPEATAEALQGGWLHSGDAGTVDEDGYLYIRDRIKDMILSGGENVYPAEIEAVLHRHPEVAEASVIGVPDEKWGETVMAVIVLEPGAKAAEDELDRHCRANLGGYKLPRRYAFVPSLPRNASGKILKRELRSVYWANQSRQVS